MDYVYQCKKNGLDYAVKTDATLNAQDAYAWRRGVREYLDNYHASIRLKNKDGTRAWQGDDESFRTEVHKYVAEALARFNVGDVPGERQPASPEAVAARKLASEIQSDPGLKAAIEKLMASRKKAA